MPTGVRMPVESMSIRPLIGMVQALATPGIERALSSSSRRSPTVLNRGRHSSSGFRLTTVSNISSGAGSVGVSARPALPNTWRHFRELLQDPVLELKEPATVVDGRAGHGDRHVEQRPFVEGRHELRAELA